MKGNWMPLQNQIAVYTKAVVPVLEPGAGIVLNATGLHRVCAFKGCSPS